MPAPGCVHRQDRKCTEVSCPVGFTPQAVTLFGLVLVWLSFSPSYSIFCVSFYTLFSEIQPEVFGISPLEGSIMSKEHGSVAFG